MRLHRLEITAFGPFADLAEVDFDGLSSAGLFLLCGPTGAGKTSVLDAVCFALYGDVPGDRSSARRLRCDTAPDGRAPRVVLEVTLSGRRFRITRSPHWSRPKKRGSGETTEQARVLVEERIAGDWTALSSRIDEANHFLNGLIGMTLPQFCQVAMLPQGRFQAFLRARSEERHTLLQQLFGTRRFEDIEKWLREQSRILSRDSRRLLAEVGRVASRILEVSASEPLEGLDLDDPADVAADGRLGEWAQALRSGADEDAALANGAVQSATEVERAAAAAVADATRVAQLQRRHAEAQATAERLVAEADAVASRRERIDAARRAARLVPLHNHALATARHRDRLEKAALDADTEAAAALGSSSLTTQQLEAASRESQALLAQAEPLLPREAECEVLAAFLTEAQARASALSSEHEMLLARQAELPEQLEAARLQETEARVAAGEATVATAELTRLQEQLDAGLRVTALTAELFEATELLAAAVTTCQAHKERWLDLRETRLAGMAGEIAAELAVGDSCPVCGSADHPHKATRAIDAPDADAEKAARSVVDDAEVEVTALQGVVRDLTTMLAVAREQAGDLPLDQLRPRLAEASARAELLGRSAQALPDLTDKRARLEAEGAELQARAQELAREQSELGARIAGDTARLAAFIKEIQRLLGGTEFERLSDVIACHRHLVELVDAAVAARRAHESATAEAHRAETALAEAVAEVGFDSEQAALAQVIGADELVALELSVETHDRALEGARQVLAEPEVSAAAAAAAPDLVALEQAETAARATLADAHARQQAASARAARLTALTRELDDVVGAWLPVREAHLVAAELAAFVEGKSTDNQLRMRLSAYVLAWRLTQVVAAANERLLRMSDQRYTLERSDLRGAGETRGGLSLLIRDAWSGEARDPATLSGGETFVVSLALALGLADVVTGEAGGAELDTLFVDEGFGALDADTLDDVMDTLDTLRDGGRVVGVVSHVGELRTRIPTRLQVGKARHGSTVQLVHAAE